LLPSWNFQGDLALSLELDFEAGLHDDGKHAGKKKKLQGSFPLYF
jgi:hypothetical protein